MRVGRVEISALVCQLLGRGSKVNCSLRLLRLDLYLTSPTFALKQMSKNFDEHFLYVNAIVPLLSIDNNILISVTLFVSFFCKYQYQP